MNKSKLQVIASGCAFVLSVFLLVSATVAYFSDEVQITNTMTAGNVVIELTEAAVKREQGNLVENPLAPRIKGAEEATVRSYGTIYPGISIFKDPTIQNVGESDAWIAAKITFNDGDGDLSKLIGYDGAPVSICECCSMAAFWEKASVSVPGTALKMSATTISAPSSSG